MSHACSHARACHKGGRGFEYRRSEGKGTEGMIRGIATSAANRTVIARGGPGEERREEAWRVIDRTCIKRERENGR